MERFMTKQELELCISKAKENLRKELPRISACIKYLRELRDSKILDIKNSMPEVYIIKYNLRYTSLLINYFCASAEA